MFIGNSFTYYNGMPDMVRRLAEADGHKMILDTQTIGGWTLQEHWNASGTAKYKIRDGTNGQPWDVIVLNEQSTQPAYNHTEICDKHEGMYHAAKNFTDYIRKYNPKAKIQWYMTWGWKNGFQKKCKANKKGENYPAMCTYESMQERVKETYM